MKKFHQVHKKDSLNLRWGNDILLPKLFLTHCEKKNVLVIEKKNNLFLEVSQVEKLEQLEFKLEKIIGI